MKAKTTEIPGVIVVTPDIHLDSRGLFFESYSVRDFGALGITATFVQDNHSLSYRHVVRGLHCGPQGKLLRVLEGSILDVTLDMRHSSPTYGNFQTIIRLLRRICGSATNDSEGCGSSSFVVRGTRE